MNVLKIEWRYFDQKGNTCVRCSETGAALQKAVAELAEPSRLCGSSMLLRI